MSKKSRRRPKSATSSQQYQSQSPQVSDQPLAGKFNSLMSYAIIIGVVIAVVATLIKTWPTSLEQEINTEINSCLEQCQGQTDQNTCLATCRTQQLESIALPE